MSTNYIPPVDHPGLPFSLADSLADLSYLFKFFELVLETNLMLNFEVAHERIHANTGSEMGLLNQILITVLARNLVFNLSQIGVSFLGIF